MTNWVCAKCGEEYSDNDVGKHHCEVHIKEQKFSLENCCFEVIARGAIYGTLIAVLLLGGCCLIPVAIISL